ncbi:hypothetical protein ACLKA6_010160 [Drosophila palustris]
MSEINRLMARRRILNSRIQQLQEPGDHVLRNQLKQLKEEQKKTKQIIKNMKKKWTNSNFSLRTCGGVWSSTRVCTNSTQLLQHAQQHHPPQHQSPQQHQAPQHQPPQHQAPQHQPTSIKNYFFF